MQTKELPRDQQGKLESFAWPGGYQIVYVDFDNSTLCPECAQKSESNPEEIPNFKPQGWYYLDEGKVEYCEQCSRELR